MIVNNNTMVFRSEKQTEESNILGYLSTRNRFFPRSMDQIFPPYVDPTQ